jgi:hypothetical protein
MKLVIVCMFLFALAFCQSPPKLSDDFTAQVEFIEEQGTHRILVNATLYVDYTNKRERWDSDHIHDHPQHVEFLRLFDKKIEYELLGTSDCKNHTLNRAMHGSFDWVANATLDKNPCHTYFNSTIGKIGQLWNVDDHHRVATLCVSTDQTTPYWTEFRQKETVRYYRAVQYYTFTPGAPDPSLFNVPPPCSKRS